MEVPIIKITEGAGAAKIAFSRLSAWVCGVNMKGWKTPSQIKTKNLLSSAVATRLSNTNSTQCRATQDNLALGWGQVVPIRRRTQLAKNPPKGFLVYQAFGHWYSGFAVLWTSPIYCVKSPHCSSLRYEIIPTSLFFEIFCICAPTTPGLD